MRLNRALAVLIIAAAVSGLPIVATDAAVPAPPVTVSDLDVSSPGHLTGTVTTDAPFVWVCFNNCRLSSGQTNDGQWLSVPADTHELDFDLPTWGHSEGKVIVRGCSVAPPAWEACAAPSYSVPSDVLIPTDLVPTIAWPTDTTIGRNGDDTPQQVGMAVSDPGGGGNLKLVWSYVDPWTRIPGGQSVPLAHEGPATLDLEDGVGTLRVYRCAIANVSACTSYTAPGNPTVTVARGAMRATLASATVITSGTPDNTATIRTDHSGDYTLDWSIEQDGVTVPGSEGRDAGTIGEDGTITFTIPGAGLPDGHLTVAGQLVVDDPDFGSYSSPLTTEAALTADRAGPAYENLTVSRTTIHPKAVEALSAYRWVGISIKDSEQVNDGDRVEIRNTAGATVRHLVPWAATSLLGLADWDGRDDAGVVVPAGSYTVVAVDALGNPSPITRTVTVSHAKGVLHTYRRTVSAAGSTIDKYVGRCSTLRRPSLRGWSGSLGYYSNSRCRRTSRASTVSTLNAFRLPRTSAVRYLDARVDTYGGASRRVPRSHGLIRLWAADEWTSFEEVSRRVGTHTGPRRPGAVDGDRWVVWNFATALGNRYDVKSFTVTARYYSWQ